MKKLLIIISFLLLTSCNQNYNPRRVAYPFSLFFYQNEDPSNIYGLSLLTSTPYKSATVELESGLDIDLIIANETNSSLDKLINEIRLEGSTNINYSYVRSLIIHTNLINTPYLDKLLSLCYFNLLLRPNIFIYTTSLDYKSLYDVTSSNGKSPYFNLLQTSFPSESEQVFKQATLNEFMSSFYDNRTSYLLNINVSDESEFIKNEEELKENKQYKIDGVYYTLYNKKEFVYLKKEDLLGLTYYNEFKDFYLNNRDDEHSIYIEKTKRNYDIENNTLTIDISSRLLNSIFDQNEENVYFEIKNKIYKIVEDTYTFCYSKDIDVFYIYDLSKRRKITNPKQFKLVINMHFIFQNVDLYI